MGIIIRIFLVLAIVLPPISSWSETSFFWVLSSLNDIRDFNKKELHEIHGRYKECRHQTELFSIQQFKLIQKRNLVDTIGKIILHKDISLSTSQELIDFALQVADSKLSFDVIEPRIIKYLHKGEAVFSALKTAIFRAQFHIWKENNFKEVEKSNTPFMRSLRSLSLDQDAFRKVVNAYATCIVPFSEPELNKFLRPTVCDPLEDYLRPRHTSDHVSVCQTPSDKNTDEVMAYRLLMKEARSTADGQNRNALERLVMAKCIAEQSLKFFTPSHHLLKSLNRLYMMEKKSPEEAFFLTSGICGNFSGMAYNIANEIGLLGHVFLAKKGVHVYLELEDHGLWYHAHPFNSKSRCHLIFFKNTPSGEEMHH